jgi:hypothetical protein
VSHTDLPFAAVQCGILSGSVNSCCNVTVVVWPSVHKLLAKYQTVSACNLHITGFFRHHRLEGLSCPLGHQLEVTVSWICEPVVLVVFPWSRLPLKALQFSACLLPWLPTTSSWFYGGREKGEGKAKLSHEGQAMSFVVVCVSRNEAIIPLGHRAMLTIRVGAFFVATAMAPKPLMQHQRSASSRLSAKKRGNCSSGKVCHLRSLPQTIRSGTC